MTTKSEYIINRKGEEVKRRDWLKDIRKSKGLTIREVARQLELSHSHYADIENNRRTPSLEKAQKIATFYGFEINKFTV